MLVCCDLTAMKKALIALGALVLVLGGLFIWRGEAALMGLRAAQTEKTDIDNLKALLLPNMIIRKPEGEGPFPIIFQFHGCAGARLSFQEMWADVAVKNGYMAVIVDSLRPRGMSREKALETVCRGTTLIGQERAGDILAAFDHVLTRNDVDTENIILAGWSHGAWTVMDAMTMDWKNKLPASLEIYEGPRPSVKGTILFYPYCGIGALTRTRNWVHNPKVLALIAGEDTIVNHKECLTALDKLEGKGLEVDRTVYPDTEHAFDDPFLEEAWQHWHNPENFKDATVKYEAFLNRLN